LDEPSSATETLLVLAAKGDSDAVTSLFQQHRPRLRRMVEIHLDERLRARVDASDIVQEAMAEAHRSLPEYLGARPLQFYPWLRQIAFQRLVKVHRQHLGAQRRDVRREQQSLYDELSEDSLCQLVHALTRHEAEPLQQILAEEMNRLIRNALDRLSSDDRQVLVLRFLEQLSTSETAEVLGISESAVKMRQLRALQRLQDGVKNLGELP
jgi:RNA polymerase sigma-70 factor (ECF subfamily)